MIKLCVLFGGASSEHEVSLLSATSVLNNIDRDRMQVHMLGITKEGAWRYYDGPVELLRTGEWERSRHAAAAVLSPDRTHKGILLLDGSGKVLPVDVVFPVLHGKNGEDGTVQGLLELAGIPYVGCGVQASAVCMDKETAHHLLLQAGVPKTELVAVHPRDLADWDSLAERLSPLGFPLFVKPAQAGSSVGVSKVPEPGALRVALEEAFRHDGKAVVEMAVAGREVECAVMGNREPIAAQVLGEITPTHEFYDYEGKYLDDSTGLHVPARVDAATADRVRALAVKAYGALGCEGMARVDFFVMENGEVVLNELNTIPGFTRISMFPRLFGQSGTPYPQLINRLVELALSR